MRVQSSRQLNANICIHCINGPPQRKRNIMWGVKLTNHQITDSGKGGYDLDVEPCGKGNEKAGCSSHLLCVDFDVHFNAVQILVSP